MLQTIKKVKIISKIIKHAMKYFVNQSKPKLQRHE